MVSRVDAQESQPDLAAGLLADELAGASAVFVAARGLGLGKWLKAAMLKHVQAHCPGARWIQTNNADENAAMLGINVKMGFQPWAQFTEWQLKLPQ